MKRATKRKATFLAGFAVYFAAIWYLWYTPAIYPIKIFVVLLHEVSHGAALIATGGAVDSITLDPYQGGATYGRGGSRILTLSAGYLGSLLWGSLLVVVAHLRGVSPTWILSAVGGAVTALTLVYVRNPFGLGFGVLFGLALILAARSLPALWNRRVLLVLGLTSCLYAILDIKSDILDRPDLQSDAAMLADITGIPTLVWGVLWTVVALGVSAALFRWAYRRA